jgi:hypothetical protein
MGWGYLMGIPDGKPGAEGDVDHLAEHQRAGRPPAVSILQ